MSLATHSRRAYATIAFKCGEYEAREGQAISTFLALQLDAGGWTEFFQWRSKERPEPLGEERLAIEMAVRRALRAEARRLPCPRPIRLNNNAVLMA